MVSVVTPKRWLSSPTSTRPRCRARVRIACWRSVGNSAAVTAGPPARPPWSGAFLAGVIAAVLSCGDPGQPGLAIHVDQGLDAGGIAAPVPPADRGPERLGHLLQRDPVGDQAREVHGTR